MMALTYAIMGYCFPMIASLLFKDWWQSRSLSQAVDE